MRSILFLGLVLCTACGDSGITPEPKEPSDGGSTANGGAPSTGGSGPIGGGTPDGGAPQGGSVPGVETESGSRLKVMTHVGSDGSRFPGGWFDSELNTECSWSTAADGSRRCLPNGLTATYYSDAACTALLALQDPCGAKQFAVVLDTAAACGARRHIFPLAAQAFPVNVWTKSGNSCFGVVTPDGELFSVGPEIGSGEFVSEAIEIEP